MVSLVPRFGYSLALNTKAKEIRVIRSVSSNVEPFKNEHILSFQ